MGDYELLDHTADIGIRVKGADLKSLFINAAAAMFDIIADGPKLPKGQKAQKKTIKVRLKAKNREELFVRWLSELLSLSDCEDVFFADFDIAALSDTALEGKAVGIPRRHFVGKREVKAVTYHQLKLTQEGAAYSAEVIFDV